MSGLAPTPAALNLKPKPHDFREHIARSSVHAVALVVSSSLPTPSPVRLGPSKLACFEVKQIRGLGHLFLRFRILEFMLLCFRSLGFWELKVRDVGGAWL